jgi:hypothetical protein
VLCAGSFPPPHAPDALATTTSASEAASKSERDLRSTRGKVQRGWDEQCACDASALPLSCALKGLPVARSG